MRRLVVIIASAGVAFGIAGNAQPAQARICRTVAGEQVCVPTSFHELAACDEPWDSLICQKLP